MNAKHEGGHYFKIKYDWIKLTPEGGVEIYEIDTGFLKDWNLVHIQTISIF